MSETLIERLRKRAEIRRQISTRKSVQEGKPDRIADVLEEAAKRIEDLELLCKRAGQDFGSWFGTHWEECEARDAENRAPEDEANLDAWEKENCDCFLKLIAALKEAGEGK